MEEGELHLCHGCPTDVIFDLHYHLYKAIPCSNIYGFTRVHLHYVQCSWVIMNQLNSSDLSCKIMVHP